MESKQRSKAGTRLLPSWIGAVVLAMATIACGAEDPAPAGVPGGMQAPAADDGVSEGPCDEGDVKTCKIWLPEHNGVKSCFIGEQYCEDGEWSPCWEPADDGEQVEDGQGGAVDG